MYWDTAAFRDRFKNDYEGKGNKFISDLRQNNQEIFSKITAQNFPSIISFATDTACKCRFYDVTALALAAEELTEYLDQHKNFDYGVISMRNDFGEVQQRKAADLFIQMLESTSDVINTWESFRNNSPPQKHYEYEIEQVRDLYRERKCSLCQLI